MEEEVKKLLQEKYKKHLGKAPDVFSICAEFFGEENVDLQYSIGEEDYIKNFTCGSESDIDSAISRYDDYIEEDMGPHLIYIHFPEVTIRNEEDESALLKDIYVQIKISSDGTIPDGQFKILRSTFTKAEFTSRYVHSHVSALQYDNLSAFKKPCTGEGPINKTLATLIATFDKDIWELFCVELSAYLRVESINGGPYQLMRYIGTTDLMISYQWVSVNDSLSISGWNSFIEYLIKNLPIKVSFTNGTYSLAYSFNDLVLLISNIFLEWVKSLSLSNTDIEDLYELYKVNKYVYKDNHFYLMSSINSYTEYEGQYLFTFKNHPINLHIEKQKGFDEKFFLLIGSEPCLVIIKNLTKLINLYNGKSKYKTNDNIIKNNWYLF